MYTEEEEAVAAAAAEAAIEERLERQMERDARRVLLDDLQGGWSAQPGVLDDF